MADSDNVMRIEADNGEGECIQVGREKMRALARYEETFSCFRKEGEDSVRLSFDNPYVVTLEDLYYALENLTKKNLTIGEMGEEWYFPLSNMSAAFRLFEDNGDGQDDTDVTGTESEENTEVTEDTVRGLTVTERQAFFKVWNLLEDIWINEEDDTLLSDTGLFKKCSEIIENWYSNSGKHVLEMNFLSDEAESFIDGFNSDERERDATDAELNICRRLADRLCLTDSGPALHLKAYSCYGGNRIYPCDWKASEECLLRLYELTDDAGYANSLGYIYYYGRVNGGEPEYEKAFSMFSVAAANGLYEGAYKLADMYRNGYACKKSPKTAKALYSQVYNDCLKQLTVQDEGNLADAALRMGDVYFYGIGTEQNIEAAYEYYLQADYAARKRLETTDFFGAVSVADRAAAALSDAKAKLPEDRSAEPESHKFPPFADKLLELNRMLTVTVTPQSNGDCTLHFAAVKTENGRPPKPVLVTETRQGFCALLTELDLTAVSASVTLFSSDSTMKISSIDWDYSGDRICLYNGDSCIAWIECREFRINTPAEV